MRLFFILCLSLITAAAQAQSGNTETRKINVTGSAEMLVSPNIITLDIMLNEYQVGKTTIPLTVIDQRLLDAVASSNIEKEDLVVTKLSQTSYTKKRKRTTQASKSYNITFRSHASLMSFTKKLLPEDIAYMRIKSLNHSDMPALRMQVKKEALRAAKRKAEELVAVYDERLGPVLIINESSYSGVNHFSNAALPSAGETELLNPDEIGFSKLKLRFEMNVTFEIR